MARACKAYIAGAYEHPTRHAVDRSVAQLHAEVARGALADAELSKDNVDGYFDHLLAYFEHAAREGFLRTEHRQMLMVARTPAELLDLFEHYEPPVVKKWVEGERQS